MITEDFYILQLLNIKPKQLDPSTIPVLFQSGLFDSSDSWFCNSDDKNLPYRLLEQGRSVWVGNVRGSKHSRQNSRISPNDDKFWDFSFEDMATKDLPAMIDMVLKTEQQNQLDYISHSQGTTLYFIGVSEKTDFFNKKINKFIALGPVTDLTNLHSLFLSGFAAAHLDYFFRKAGINEMFPSGERYNWYTKMICDYLRIACETVTQLLVDSDLGDENKERMPVFYSHFPSGTSLKNLIHFAQLIRNKRFAKFDYGYDENVRRYGLGEAPLFDLSKVIGDKVHLVVGDKDRLATVEDNKKLAKVINAKAFKVLADHGHASFLMTKQTIVNDLVLEYLGK